MLVAEDQFLEQLSTPQPRFSPSNETLVNFDTWLWVDNIPDSGEDGPWGMSILDGLMSVEAWATMHEVRWNMGDADDPESEFDCPLTTTEADAKDNCTYEYKRSSAGQPGDEFQGNVSVVWEVNWTANVFGQELSNEEPVEAVLDNEFSIAVAESQAIITD